MNANHDFSLPKKVLFVSVHPDDETLGCCGAILKHRKQGDSIYWLNITGASADHPHGFRREVIDERNRLTDRISLEYGFARFINLNLPTMLLDTYSKYDLVGKIDSVIRDMQPQVIYIPNRSDVHSDHRVSFEVIYSCTKSFRKPYLTKIIMYETLSETEFAPSLAESSFVPNMFIDITEFIEGKVKIMSMYDTEIMPDPYPRSIHAIKALAAFRGSRIGVQYAEAFQILLEIYH